MLESATSIYENFDSKFCRTTTGMQSGLDSFEESRLVMIFLTNLRVTRVLYSFGLVLEGEKCRETPESPR